MRTLVWFRGKELRVSDHEPLHDAIRGRDAEVICLFVVDPFFFAPERARQLPHRMQFLLESIASLQANLERLGAKLFLVGGKSIEVVPELAREWKVDRVVAHRWTEPFGRVRDEKIAAALAVPFDLYEGETLAPPGTVLTGSGTPFAVFTPFARAHRKVTQIDAPKRAPAKVPPPPADVKVRETNLPTLEALGIEENPNLLRGGEKAARDRLQAFVRGAGAHYESERNRMDVAGTSRLSQDLKFGVLSARTVWKSAEHGLAKDHPKAWATYSNELLWREFTHAMLHAHPDLLRHPWKRDFDTIAWKDIAKDEGARTSWTAWTLGTTGYPVVDASARQLLGEGFVHNRARMISASFLVKDLLLDYRLGEAHYMTYLTDGDWAQNNAGWQWSAGCGFDAQPFFRVFNPVSQGERFDPTGSYVRRWVPELTKMPDKYIHAPWTAPPEVLRAANVTLGQTYPPPIVDHARARERFLSAAKARRS